MPFVLSLRSGPQIYAQALLPQLGANKGIIIVNKVDELGADPTDIVNAGYGYSVLDDIPVSENYDLDSYVEMFTDWGWGAVNERKPQWMK